MDSDLMQTAINQALSGLWKEAIKTNLILLKTESKNIETLNRLGRAYLETGQKTKADKVYNQVLKLDKYNNIAHKNLLLLKTLRIDRSDKKPSSGTIIPMFLEEPGVTKTVTLVRLGDPKTISRQRPGDLVKLVSRQHNVAIVTGSGQYLGRISDDLAMRLRTFMAAGNSYEAWLRSVDTHELRVFIREVTRSKKYQQVPSFPLTEKLTYAAFTPPELVHEEKPDVSTTEYQEEEIGANKEGEPEEAQD
ncbi:MAG: hypothetical protein Q7S31_01935 [bacterium]|nr:hypothetical protein [bacterium]